MTTSASPRARSPEELGPVLGALRLPADPVAVVGAVLGEPARVARQLVGWAVACAPEAEELLDTMPRILRSLAIATTDTPVRCAGELRGPVLWSETMAARAAAAGDPGVVVCAAANRAYDTAENRVLVAALDAIARAGSGVDAGTVITEDAVRQARANGHRAQRCLDHQALAGLPIRRPHPREERRTRAGSRRSTYRPALEVLSVAGQPLSGPRLRAWADPAAAAGLDLLEALLRAAAGAGRPVRLVVRDGALTAGALTYRHPGSASTTAPAGLWVAGAEVATLDDVPGAVPRL